MKVHCFDPKLAKQVGMAAAVIFYHISFWIDHNAKNEQNFRDGRYWTYNSVKAFSLQFPYLTPKQIRTALDKLVTSRLIIKAEHNADRSDRTTWYALGMPFSLRGKPTCPRRQMRELPLRAALKRTDINQIKNLLHALKRVGKRIPTLKKCRTPIRLTGAGTGLPVVMLRELPLIVVKSRWKSCSLRRRLMQLRALDTREARSAIRITGLADADGSDTSIDIA